MKVDLNSQLAREIHKLKFDISMSTLTGDYKTAKAAKKELAKIGVDNFELVTKVPNPVSGSFPLFSKEGFNVLMYMLIDKFRIKTPEEKKFEMMAKLFKEGKLKV